MRQILSTLFCILGGTLGAFAYNESVAAISYNPSRLGAYEKLRAVSSAKLLGGLKADTINITSKAEVTLDANQAVWKEGTNTYQGDPSVEQATINTIKTIEPDGMKNTQADTGAFVQKFYSSANALDSYTLSSDVPTSNIGSEVKLSGGKMTITNNAYVSQMGNNKLIDQLEARSLQLGTVSAQEGLVLGQYKVPTTSGSTYKFVDISTTDGTTQKVLGIE